MNTTMRQVGMGLMFSLFTLGLSGNVNAQILKGVKDATSKVVTPMKDVQSTTQSVTKPISTTRKDIKTITKAPTEIKQEAERTKGEFDKAGSDIQQAGADIKRTKDGLGNKNSKDDSDSTATTTTTTTTAPSSDSKEDVVIDERRNRAEVGSNKTTPSVSNNETIAPKSKGLTARPRPVAKSKTATTAPASAGSRSVAVTPANSTLENAPKVKPDYSNSPARYALQRADFDTETLQDLFDNAVWDGPGRAHTMRSISFHLRQLKTDIDEIRRIDQGAKVSHYDRQYKEWYAEYTRREREGQAEN